MIWVWPVLCGRRVVRARYVRVPRTGERGGGEVRGGSGVRG